MALARRRLTEEAVIHLRLSVMLVADRLMSVRLAALLPLSD
jgi:hypothetical protein